MADEVKDLITALRDGRMSLDAVAQRFRERSWPRTKPPRPTSYLEMAEAANRDPEPDVPDSFDEVVAARNRGEITEEQYWVLAEAVVEAKGAKPPPDE